MSSLDIALAMVRGPGRLSALAPHFAPLLLYTEIETALPEIETDLRNRGRSQFAAGRKNISRLQKCLSI